MTKINRLHVSYYFAIGSEIRAPLLWMILVEKFICSFSRAAGALVILSLLCEWSNPTQAQQHTSSTMRPVHIGVLVRQLDGDPFTYLRSKDFRVFTSGLRLPVAVARIGRNKSANTGLPNTRVLVIVSPDFAAMGSSIDTLIQSMPDSFGQSSVSVVGANGIATKYVSTRQALIADLQSGHIEADCRQAIDQLGSYPGRRAVIFATNNRIRTPLSIRDAAAKSNALVYQVGGDTADNYTYWGQGAVTNTGNTWESFAMLSIRDLHVVRSMRQAFHDIAKDNAGYYDLRVEVPVAEQTLTLGLSIRQDYQISTQAYDLDNRPVPTLILQKNH